MKKIFLLIIACCASSLPLFGAPAAITDLQISDAASGFRHVGLSWTVPYDAAASTTPAFYALRLSTAGSIGTESEWNTNSSVTTYPYRISWSTSGITAGSRNMCVVTGLTDGQAYFFAIKSSTDNITWSAVDTVSPRPFKTPFNTAPQVVGGQNYINGDIAVTATPILTWTAPSAGNDDDAYSDRICSYTVELSRYFDFSAKIEKTGITAASWTTSPLTENASYYWRVKAGDLENLYSGSFASQDSRYFYVNAVNEAPASFTLIGPVNSQIVATRRPTFQWNASSDPDPGDTFTYTLYYSTDPAFVPAVTTVQPNLAVLQYQPPVDLEENATCYWKVFAVDAAGKATMAVSTGTVRLNFANEAPLAFGLSSPANGERILISTPTLSWQTTSDPDPGNTMTYSVLYSSSDPTLASVYTAVNSLAVTQYSMPTLQEDTTYWWRVQAVDNNLAITQTTVRDFFVDAAHAQPPAFSLLSSSGIVTTARPAFVWQSSVDPGGDPVSYTLSYSTSSDFSIATTTSGLSAALYTPPANLSENTSYYWRVRADTIYGQNRLSSETWTVVIDAAVEPPQAFHLLSPANNAAVTYLQPALDWQDTVDPDPSDPTLTYTLSYSTAADFSVQTQVAGIAVSSYTFAGALSNGDTYYWKVRAVSTRGGGTDAAETWHFCSTNQPPGTFNGQSPTGLVSAAAVTFNWTTSFDPENDAVSYSVCYSSYADFRTYVSSAGHAATHCTLPAFEENQTYYWYVRAADSWGNVRQSAQTLCFGVNVVNEAPRDFALTSPANGARVTTVYPPLAWQAAVDPDPADTVSYTLWISRDPDFTARTAVSELSAPSYTVTAGLTLNATYYWRVYAVGSDGMQKVSDTGNFFVAQVLRLTAPASLAAALGAGRTSAALSWAAVTTDIDGSAIGETAGYRVYKSYDFDGLFSASAFVSLSTGTLQWTDTDVRSLPVYYMVRAYTPSGLEGYASAAQKVAADSERMNYTDDLSLTVTYRPQVLPAGDVTITRVGSDENSGVRGSYAIAVSRNGQTISGFTFSEPVTIAFKLPQSAAAPARAPAQSAGYAVYWYNGVEWVNLGGRSENGQMSVETTFTGRYQLRTASRSGSFSLLKAWPKIITPNGDSINDEFNYTFENPAGDRIEGKIFDMSGSLAGRMTSKSDYWLFWDGRDDSGSTVPCGMYLYQVTVGNAVYSGTVVVAR